MKKNRLTIISALLLLLLPMVAKNQDTVRSLKIGDKLPDIVISKIMDVNGVVKNARISDYKNQLLILDFMNTG